MADAEQAIKALKETRPPATDRFTYLTLVERYLSPEIFPALNDILQDAELSQDIGWDLVELLVPLSGSEECLETIARLGNPREVILKVLEVLEQLYDNDEDDGDAPTAVSVNKFITLLGMLAILHQRIKTKYPSRFLGTTLRTVLSTYRPNPKMTASTINLVHSLSAWRRPTLPKRKSSVNVANPDQDGNASKNAPDPEAETEDPTEGEIQQKLLLSFVTCILDSYVNANDMEWSARFLEYFNPNKSVPGKRTALERYRNDQELAERDAVVGQLVALTRDVGLLDCSETFIQDISTDSIRREPLADIDDISGPQDVELSTGGCISLLAYWLFSSTVFKASQPQPSIYLFPTHFSMLSHLLSDDPASAIATSPGTIEAAIAIGLWLQHSNLLVKPPGNINDNDEANDDNPAKNFMPHTHLLTLCAVFHPSLATRNAAVALAGAVLHGDLDGDDRLRILEDLLENCAFAALKACAVSWLREEIIAAAAPQSQQGGGSGVFAGPEAVERLQYAVFPDMAFVKNMSSEEFLEYWAENAPFVLQAANFALFLFGVSKAYRAWVPAGMGPAVEMRYVEPLLSAAGGLESAVAKKEVGDGEDMGPVLLDLRILLDRLTMLSLV